MNDRLLLSVACGGMCHTRRPIVSSAFHIRLVFGQRLGNSDTEDALSRGEADARIVEPSAGCEC